MMVLFTCSISMSMIMLIYLMSIPFLERRYSNTGCYYGWLIIVLGLIVPFRPKFDSCTINNPNSSKLANDIIQIGNSEVSNFTTHSLLPQISKIYLWQVMVFIWLIGVFIFIGYYMIKHYCSVKTMKRWSEPLFDEQIIVIFQKLKMELGIFKQIDIKLCSVIRSPILLGYMKPQILLPKADYSKDDLYCILKHELIHYKRKDLWYKLIILIANAIHWFNPIVYLMVRNINTQCELSCDENLTANMDEKGRLQYCETICNVAKYKPPYLTALSTNFYGGKNDMKKRFLSIMKYKQKQGKLLIIFSLFVAIFLVGVMTSEITRIQDDIGDDAFKLVISLNTEHTVNSLNIHSYDGNGELIETSVLQSFNESGIGNYVPASYMIERGEIEDNTKFALEFEAVENGVNYIVNGYIPVTIKYGEIQKISIVGKSEEQLSAIVK